MKMMTMLFTIQLSLLLMITWPAQSYLASAFLPLGKIYHPLTIKLHRRQRCRAPYSKHSRTIDNDDANASPALYQSTIHFSKAPRQKESSRREFLERSSSSWTQSTAAFLGISSLIWGPQPNSAALSTATSTPGKQDDNDESTSSSIIMPLFFIPSLNAYIIKYQVGGDRFGAIVDTGSPFLTVPNYCREKEYGCYHPERSQPSGLPESFEIFDNNQGKVEWRRARFAFVNATQQGGREGPAADDFTLTFGVLSDSLLSGSGGVFLGLIRDTDGRIRPSFLGQTNVKSFAIDLASHQKTLTLSTNNLLRQQQQQQQQRSDYVPLTTDLSLKYRDPVCHYTAKAEAVMVNGSPFFVDGKPIYVIFDTGLTGMAISQDLWNQRYDAARRNREKNFWGFVTISFRSHGGRQVTLEATKPITTPLGGVTWPGFDAHLLIAGLAFLDKRRTVIDIDDKAIWIE